MDNHRMDNNHWTGTSNFHGGEDHFGTLPDDIWAANFKCQYIQSTRSGNRFPRTNARIQWATSKLLRIVGVPRTNSKVYMIAVKIQSRRGRFLLIIKSKYP